MFAQIAGLVADEPEQSDPNGSETNAEEEAAPTESKGNGSDNEGNGSNNGGSGDPTGTSMPAGRRASLRKVEALSSNIFGGVTPGPQPTIRVHAAPGGKSSINLGGDSHRGSGPPKASDVVPEGKCRQLSEVIYKSGRLKTVFQSFVGDAMAKRITQPRFREQCSKYGISFSAEEVTGLFTAFIKGAEKDVMGYSSFVRLVTSLSQ